MKYFIVIVGICTCWINNIDICFSQEAITVKLCELISDSNKYHNERVVVQGSFRFAFELQEIFCLKCWNDNKIWVDFNDDADESGFKLLKKLPGMGIANVTFEGIFHSNGFYGHLGYHSEIIVDRVISLKMIAKGECDPARLSAKNIAKLCKE